MASFDTVIVPCPKCNTEIYFISKAGECDFIKYDYRSVPPEIAVDLINDMETCDSCGTKVSIDANISNIQMYIKDYE